MWQDAHANRLSMFRIVGLATSGPRYSEVCAMSRFPYSSVALRVAEDGATRPDGNDTLPKASVAATEITPTSAQSATTIPMPRGEVSGFIGKWSFFGSAPDHRFARLPGNDT
jgi:hypothetical protein